MQLEGAHERSSKWKETDTMKLYKQPNNYHALVDKWEKYLSVNHLGGTQGRVFGLLFIAIYCFCTFFGPSLSLPFKTYIAKHSGNYNNCHVKICVNQVI